MRELARRLGREVVDIDVLAVSVPTDKGDLGSVRRPGGFVVELAGMEDGGRASRGGDEAKAAGRTGALADVGDLCAVGRPVRRGVAPKGDLLRQTADRP